MAWEKGKDDKLPCYTSSASDLFSGKPSNYLVERIINYNQNKKGVSDCPLFEIDKFVEILFVIVKGVA